MKKTLYERLIGIDELKKGLEESYKEFASLGIILDDDFTCMDYKGMQLSIFKDYEARKGKIKSSIESIVDELTEPFKGWGKFFPYLPLKKREEHNKKLDDLSKLIPETSSLKLNLFDSIRPILIGSICAAAAYPFMRFVSLTLLSGFIYNKDTVIATANYVGLGSIPICGWFFSHTSIENLMKDAKKAKEKAQYLDTKIKELS